MWAEKYEKQNRIVNCDTLTWDSLAEAYYVNGQKSKALESFQKALELDPNNSDLKKKVEKLKE